MTIRQYAKQAGHEIVGKLTRHQEWEYKEDTFGERKHSGVKSYSDEGGNCYHVSKRGVCIVTADDTVI